MKKERRGEERRKGQEGRGGEEEKEKRGREEEKRGGEEDNRGEEEKRGREEEKRGAAGTVCRSDGCWGLRDVSPAPCPTREPHSPLSPDPLNCLSPAGPAKPS